MPYSSGNVTTQKSFMLYSNVTRPSGDIFVFDTLNVRSDFIMFSV